MKESDIRKIGDGWKIQTKASLSNVRTSANKTRRVINQIRGCSYEQALVLLEFMPYKACYFVLQPILSAAANASASCESGFDKSNFFISEAHVGNATSLRRSRPRAQGRGYPVRKPTCHVTVKLMLRDQTEKKKEVISRNVASRGD
uniref:Large ribosomal subunit protein uL22c n=1 Tax=Schizaea pectinata TaxID=148576 RepID=A0A286QHK5_9MONI|nr:ribosomal protein L22 [Schizaea pectinata]APT66093.1 ribosomal protein L22 [Schizaea pectinata]